MYLAYRPFPKNGKGLIKERRRASRPTNDMNTEQHNSQRPARKKATPTDIILILLGIMILFRTPWNDMNSFHYLLFFLYALCIILRISNLRKERMQQMAAAQRKAEAEAKALESESMPEIQESKEPEE